MRQAVDFAPHDRVGGDAEPGKRKLVTYFLATVRGEPALRLDEAHAIARWVPVSELHDLDLKYTEDRRVLDEIVRLVGRSIRQLQSSSPTKS